MKREKQLFIYLITTLALVVISRGILSIVACDDAFITFRYSENIASGKGFVYNEGERILGTSTPLFALLLAGLRLLGLDVVLSSHILSILFHFAISLLILLILKDQGYYFAGMIASFCFALDKLVLTAYGMETNLYIALLLASFYYLTKRNILLSWVFASLMTFCRADGFIWILVLFVITLIRYRKAIFRAAIPAILILLPWFIFSYLYFGNLLPHTVSVKLLNVPFFYNSFISAVPYYLKNFYVHFFPLTVLGIFFSIWKREQIAILFAYSIAYLGIFALMRAQHSHWYFIPLVPVIYIFFAFNIDAFFKMNLKCGEPAWLPQMKKAILLLPALIVVFYGFRLAMNLRSLGIPDKSSKAFYYKETGLWLRDNTPTTAKVMMGEIGIMGYYSNRRIIDMGGLVTLLDELDERSPDVIAEHFKPEYYIAGAGSDSENLVLGNSIYKLVSIKEGKMGIYKRVEDIEHKDIETLPKNGTIKNGIEDDPASKLNFLRDFTGRN
ncbi:hypothetical protein KKB18_11100 [bacterium]|nr:hypothetical protein [bacterium]